ncbi:MAG TPA: serine/threonine-protein kinase [Gaiellaceae bacterium]|nr:serine/threonine-protein kinase [Gaiellaceae bacterium]
MAVQTSILPPRYQNPREIGRGGMGEVYAADDRELARCVAVKLLADRFAQNEAVRLRFKREALTAAKLAGDGAVTIFDVGEWEGRPYIVMAFLPGGSLADRVVDGQPPRQQALDWLEQAAAALDAAHRSGIVHRDVKPANLLLDDRDHIRIGDFGVASAVGLDSLTATGTILGTAGYLAPEQAQGVRAGPPSDEYALGVVAFELLTGERPFANDLPTVEAAAHIHSPVPSACARQRTLPCEVDAVFERALAKEPGERYPSCLAFVRALRAALDPRREHTTLVAARAGPDRRFSLKPVLILLAVAAAAVAGGVGAVLATMTDDSAPPRRVVVTAQGNVTTVRETVTQTAVQPAAAPPPATSQAAPAASGGAALNDSGYSLMRDGRYEEARPLLQQAVDRLRGTYSSGNRYEAWADYNLAYTLIHLGSCAAALPLLERSEELQGRRREISTAKAAARRCS